MADISVITLPSGTSYNIKDATARADIATIRNTVTGAMHYAGVTTTNISNNSTTNPISIGDSNYTAKSGDVVIYGDKEFIFSDTDNKWHEFGPTGSFKALAFKDSATGSTKYTPQGSVSKPTFTGSSSTVTITAANNTNGNYTPAGTVSKAVFNGATITSTGSFQPHGSVTVTTKSSTNKTATVSPAASGTITYTPDGDISTPSFTGTQKPLTATGSYTPEGEVGLTTSSKTITVSPASSGTATYTPKGTIAAPTITVTPNTTTIKNPTSTTCAKTIVSAAPGTAAPANAVTYYAVSGETLSLYQLGYTTGASITTANQTVVTGIQSAQSTDPVFTGTGVRLTSSVVTPDSASFTGTSKDVTVSGEFKPEGTVSTPEFTGTGVRLVTGNIAVPSAYTASFTGTEEDISVSGETAGTISDQTFTGTKVLLSGTTTAAGEVSKPTWTGTEATISITAS